MLVSGDNNMVHWSKNPLIRDKVIQEIRKKNMGRPLSKQHKEKIRSALKGRKGRVWSQEDKNKFSVLMKGRKSPRKGLTFEQIYGEERSNLIKEKMRENNSKHFLGKKHKPSSIEKLRKQRTGKNNPSYGKIGVNSFAWKGNLASYGALHDWIRKYKPKQNNCNICNNKRKLELSNISGNYKRELLDFEWLCKKCHRKRDFDRRLKKDQNAKFFGKNKDLKRID